MWVVKPERGPHAFRSIHRNLLTGEPYAGEPPVRFGGSGVSNQWDVPTPIVGEAASGFDQTNVVNDRGHGQGDTVVA